MKLTHDKPISIFASNFNLRPYNLVSEKCQGWSYIFLDSRLPADQKRALMELALRERMFVLEDGGGASQIWLAMSSTRILSSRFFCQMVSYEVASYEVA